MGGLNVVGERWNQKRDPFKRDGRQENFLPEEKR